MDKMIFSYIKTHTVLVLTVVVGVFLLLAGGEFILYRRMMQLNKMVSEGFMQVKESRGMPEIKPVDPTLKMFRK